MERHPSTSFSITTNRHATEEAAIERAQELVNRQTEQHKLAYPEDGITEFSLTTTKGRDKKYSARVKVVVSRED